MSLLNKFTELVFGPEEDDDDEMVLTSANDQSEDFEEIAPKFSPKKSKVVNIAATTQMKVVVVQIESFEEVRDVADHLRSKKAIVINLEKLEKETARRVVDFISGGVYALGASIQKVANGIFLIAPYNVNIMADVRDELRNTGIFPWE